MAPESDDEEVFREVTEVEDLVAEANELRESPSADELFTEAFEWTRRDSKKSNRELSGERIEMSTSGVRRFFRSISGVVTGGDESSSSDP
ncbi:hypothetical protein [Halorussus lipolyticus]|uniref:hypothetical protein n=1 Tax=Halorussus lipolyticus TaxID=3034024 RepID=UPI0023E7E8F6|nr:hypothetical protein [Halorussus sp. DT80]